MRIARALDRRLVLQMPNGTELRLGNLAAGGGLTVVLCALSAVYLLHGDTPVAVRDILRGATRDQNFALWEVRAPRLVVGLMAGWCIAMTGAMLQSLTRNPLADPGLLGLSQGAMVTILLLLILYPTAPSGLVPLAALVGGMAVAGTLAWLLRGGRGGGGGLAILLMGIALETLLSSVSSMLILYTPAEISVSVSQWIAGSLTLASWKQAAGLAPWAALCLPIIVFTGPLLRPLDLGEARAAALGLSLGWVKPLLLVLTVILTSTAVSAVGPLVFLGIMAPHLAQFLSPASGRARLVLAGLMGAVLVLAADLITRSAPSEAALPLGLCLTMLGVPLFIITLRIRLLRSSN